MTSPKEPGQRRWGGSLSYFSVYHIWWHHDWSRLDEEMKCEDEDDLEEECVLSSKDAAQRWEEIITLGGGGDYNVNCLLNIFSPTSPPPGATCSTWSLPILLPDIRWAILQLGCKTTLLCKSCSITCDLLYGWKPLKMCLRKSFCTIWRWWWSIGGH